MVPHRQRPCLRAQAVLPPGLAEEGAHPPGAYFSLAGKVGKRALRGSTPKNPRFLEQGRGEVYIRNLSIVGLPTNPGTLRSPPAGLLYSGR